MNDPFKKAWKILRNEGLSVTVSADDIPKEKLLELFGGVDPREDRPKPRAIIRPSE